MLCSRSMLRRVLVVATLLIALAAAVFFAWLPGFVEGRMNRVVGNEQTREISTRARTLHDHLLIADLHADSLLWGRDLAAASPRAHVDIPRLIEGNVALQVFAVVTRTPRGLNYDRNTGDSDNILPLAIAERWPIASWRSLTERALAQARRLDQLAARTPQLTVVRNQQDLAGFLAG